jgi:hypothetical protein
MTEWTNITAAQTTTRTQVAVEDTVAPEKSAMYRIIVQTAKGTTLPGGYDGIASVGPTEPANFGWNVARRTVTIDDATNILDTSVVDIVFEVNTDPGYTYSIYRQAVGNSNGTGNTTAGDYAPVSAAMTNFGPAATADGIVKLQYNPTPQRQIYNYQLRVYKDGEQIPGNAYTLTSQIAAKLTLNVAVTTTAVSGAVDAETQWYGVTPANITGLAATDELISGEAVYIYGRLNPNHPAPTSPAQNQPDGNTVLIGTARYYDGSTTYPWPTVPAGETPMMTTGYWVQGSAYYNSVTGEVK